jgi:hypothetical protein
VRPSVCCGGYAARGDGDLDYSWFIGDEAAYRIRAEVPALRQLAGRVMLIVRDAGSLKLHRAPFPPFRDLRVCFVAFALLQGMRPRLLARKEMAVDQMLSRSPTFAILRRSTRV